MSDAAQTEFEVKEGDILAGKYRVEQVLGAGGMGIVVAATHIVLQNRVALKFLQPSVAKHQQTAARFLREAQSAVKIKSPHVARVTDVGQMEETGSPYMVMEFLEGKDLGEILESEGALDVPRACQFALQACEALAAAHAAGIVHRDIKPANLFVTSAPDGSSLLKVLDFGISKNTLDMGVSSLTQTQVSMGSPLYMSPEQMRSARDVDARTDVWSLGVVLFEMLTGQLPFMAETMPQLCALVLEEKAPRADELRPGLPAPLVDTIARCLEKDRERRFGSVAQVAQNLAPYVPESGSSSAERTSRILAGSGLDRTVEADAREALVGTGGEFDVGVVAPPPKLRGTATAFGRTGAEASVPAKRPGAKVLGGAAALVALAAVSAGWLVAKGNEPASDAASAASALPSSTPVALGDTPKASALASDSPTAISGAAATAGVVASADASTSVAATAPNVADPSGGAPAEAPLGKSPRPPAERAKPKPKPQKPPESDPFGDRF